MLSSKGVSSMKYYVILFCLLATCLLIPQAAMSQDVYRSWFTNATTQEFTNYGYSSTQIAKPSGAPSESTSYGTRGIGVDLADAYAGCTFTAEALYSAATNGCISFWLRPKEAGKLASGGNNHILLKTGDPATNGLQISWDNSKGTLRFLMAGLSQGSPKTTVCRGDISSWAANDWHHVQCAWMYYDGATGGMQAGYGLSLFIDRVCVASCVFGGSPFTTNNPSVVTLGSAGGTGTTGSRAYMDELIFRTGVKMNGWDEYSALRFAYRDFFLTAPYESIEVTHMPYGDSDPYSTSNPKGVISVPSDNCILCTKQKQFGLIGTRILNTSSGAKMKEYLTNYDFAYANSWNYYDAKPNIAWSISGYATHDGDGRFTGNANTQANPTITAKFRQEGTTGALTATYATEVRRWSGTGYTKPDLGIQWVERTPRYDKEGAQKWPNPGQTVTTRVYYGNFGTKTVTATYYIKFEKAIDANNNFRIDTGETWSTIATKTITQDIAAGTKNRSSYCTWTWPATNPLTTGSVFIRVTLDSGNALGTEISESNNVRIEKSNARACHWGYHQEEFDSWFNNKTVNLKGSFSGYDWYNATLDRANIMVRTTKCDTIPSVGIQDELRTDHFVAWAGPDDPSPYDNESYLYDGGFPEIWTWDDATPMDMDTPIIHELGHTSLWTPDLYGCESYVYNMLLGTSYGGSLLYPVIGGDWSDTTGDKFGMWSSHLFDHPDEMGVGMTPLMESGNLWLSRMEAGQTHANRQQRLDTVDYPNACPRGTGKNQLKFYANDDTPLINARVWLYQGTTTGGEHGTEYYPNWPKFAGATDTSGIFTVPTTTATSWDDWNTDTVEKNVTCTSLFDTADGGPWEHDNMRANLMLVKVVGYKPGTSVPMEEFHVLPYSELMNAYFKNGGSSGTGTYEIRTHLAPGGGPGAQAPTAQTLTTNYLPYFNLTVDGANSVDTDGINAYVYVGTNQTFTINTGAADPEGQPIYYWWHTPWGTYFGGSSREASFSDPGEYWIGVWLIDGIRFTPGAEGNITVIVE